MAEEESIVVPFPIVGEQPPAEPTPAASSRSLGKRWKHEELFERGYVGVPSAFLQLYAHLNPPLTSGEALFVIHLMQYKWDAAAPFPAYKTVARQMGVSDKMTRRHAQSLETKKYLLRLQRIGTTNLFDLTPLFDAVLALAARQKAPKAS